METELFNWLMRWPIFSNTDGVVGEDENAGDLHDGSQADWRPPGAQNDKTLELKTETF